MGTQISFTRYENDLIREFRNRLNGAESVEDVHQVFDLAIRELFLRVFGDRFRWQPDDVSLNADQQASVQIHGRLLQTEAFADAWHNSDLSSIVDRLAQSAGHRAVHLEKRREKTAQKFRR